MSTKTSREIALERRKAMSDGGKKLPYILLLLKIGLDHLKIYIQLEQLLQIKKF
jgi:hypothetical protein